MQFKIQQIKLLQKRYLVQTSPIFVRLSQNIVRWKLGDQLDHFVLPAFINITYLNRFMIKRAAKASDYVLVSSFIKQLILFVFPHSWAQRFLIAGLTIKKMVTCKQLLTIILLLYVSLGYFQNQFQGSQNTQLDEIAKSFQKYTAKIFKAKHVCHCEQVASFLKGDLYQTFPQTKTIKTPMFYEALNAKNFLELIKKINLKPKGSVVKKIKDSRCFYYIQNYFCLQYGRNYWDRLTTYIWISKKAFELLYLTIQLQRDKILVKETSQVHRRIRLDINYHDKQLIQLLRALKINVIDIYTKVQREFDSYNGENSFGTFLTHKVAQLTHLSAYNIQKYFEQYLTVLFRLRINSKKTKNFDYQEFCERMQQQGLRIYIREAEDYDPFYTEMILLEAMIREQEGIRRPLLN